MTRIHVRGEGGAVMYFDRGTLPEGIARRIERGDLVECDPAGQLAPVPDDETPDEPPADAPRLPKRAEARAVWVEFAVSQGMPREEAAALTKAQLITELSRDQAGR